MSSGLVLAIDQGTTNTKALVFDLEGHVVASASEPMPVAYPRPGWAEQSALDIWTSVQRTIAVATAKLRDPIDALAISNQRETIIVWDAETGEPIAPAILWQCRRTAATCAQLRADGHAELIEARTGLSLDPMFPAAKIAWILDHVAGAREAAAKGRLRAGTVDAWLLYRLTAGAAHATDHSNASRTQLFNLENLTWDEDLLRLFNVPMSLLPAVSASSGNFGLIAEGVTSLPAGTPIHSMIGDSHAALFGHGIRQPGIVKATYGTGSSLMTLTASRIASRNELSSTIAWSSGSEVRYALEGNISVSGQAAAFMAEVLGLSDIAELSTLAASVADSNGVSFVPALVGLGAPHWAPDARGIVSGLSLGTQRAHLARAALEAIAHQVVDVFEAMEADLGHDLERISADGGATRSDLLMQIEANVLGHPVDRSDLAEVSAAGAAMLAFAGMGQILSDKRGTPTHFSPALAAADRDAMRKQWRGAIARAIH